MITQAIIDDMLSRLARIPTRITHALEGWSEAQLRARPAEDAWSAAEILAHLRAVNDIIKPRAYMVLVRYNPPLIAYDERRWAEVAGYLQADVASSLATFTLLRTELVQMLRQVAPGDWQRGGVHEQRGTMTLLDIIVDLLEHEEEHCAQIAELSIT